jgi:hypothetical protein
VADSAAPPGTQDLLAAATRVRLALRRAGFSPIPVCGKRPVLPNWQHKHDTSPDEIALWARLYGDAVNSGVLTARTPALDIDVLDPDAAAAVERLARERFADRGRLVVRFGRPPKRAILFRADRPFKRIKATLTTPSGATGQQVELLGDGQQLVARGIHPNTGNPYRWFGGRPGEVRRSELPFIAESEAEALVDDAVALLVAEHGYQAKVRAKLGGVGKRARVDWSTAGAVLVEGSRNTTLCSLLGHLLRRDVDVDLAHRLGHAWNRQCCQPPLEEDEVDRTLESVAQMELERRKRGRP